SLGYDTHSFLATPADLFLVPGSDFHLRSGSPAVDAGTPMNAPAFDLAGGPRPVGAGYDVGAFENQLLHCGDNNVDPGEQCCAPGLSCPAQCTTCSSCICAQTQPVCGDGGVCGGEQCEVDADCGSGQACRDCACINQPSCDSGIVMQSALLRTHATPFTLRLSGQAVIPKPWHAVNPLANGVRIVVDGLTGPGRFDATVPGGARLNGVGWALNAAGNRWTYLDRAGSSFGVTRVVIWDRSAKTDGLVHWAIRAHSASATLPDVNQVRSAV